MAGCPPFDVVRPPPEAGLPVAVLPLLLAVLPPADAVAPVRCA
jgi:hypothetical protein